MRKLILTSGGAPREVPVGKGVTLGRNGDNTIQLEGQKIEPNHAKVSPKGNLIFIEDLDTPHGVLVNGKKVARWALNKGDVIEIGAASLRYDEDDQPEPPPTAAKPKAAVPTAKAQPSAANIKPAAAEARSQARPSNAALKAVPGSGAAKTSAAGIKPAAPTVKFPAKNSNAALKAVPPIASAKTESEVRIVLPAQAPTEKKKVSEKNIPKPKDQSQPAGEALAGGPARIKLGAASEALSGGADADTADRASPRSSMARISLAGDGPREASASERKAAIATSGTRDAAPAISGRFAAADSENLQRQAIRAAHKSERAAQVLVKPLDPRTKKILIGTGGALLVAVVAAIAWPALAAWHERSSKAGEEHRAIEEAAERLIATTPKNRDDLRVVYPQLKRAATWDQVESLLGSADISATGNILLYTPEQGAFEFPGHAFKGYYLQDPFCPNPKEAEKAPILLFLVNAENKVSMFDGDRVLARSATLKPEAQQQKIEMTDVAPTVKEMLPEASPPLTPEGKTMP